MDEGLLTKEELCEMFKISRATLDRLRKQGLPYLKIGRQVRFKTQDVNTWLKQHYHKN